MEAISLLYSTGSEQVDRLLQGMVRIYTMLFSTRIRAFYLTGSYADASAVSLSDIDLCIVFVGAMTPEEIEQALALGEACGQLSPLRLDVSIAGERALSVAEILMLKRGSLLLFGKDIRDSILLPSLDAYQKYVTWGPYRFLGQIIRDDQVLSYPLTYPDSTSEFYGYERKRIPEWYPSEMSQGTKEIVTGVLRTARAVIALKAGQYVGSKQDSVRLYREYIYDEWTDYLEMLYQKGKREWYYLIPTASADRLLLRSLCQRTLEFENYYFGMYRTYLLTLLQGKEEDTLFALERLTQVIYADQEVVAVVEGLSKSGTQNVQQATHRVLEILKS